MMALLDKREEVAVQQVILEIAESYPQALVYPYMISSENYSFEETAEGHKNKEFVERYEELWYREVMGTLHLNEWLG